MRNGRGSLGNLEQRWKSSAASVAQPGAQGPPAFRCQKPNARPLPEDGPRRTMLTVLRQPSYNPNSSYYRAAISVLASC